MGVKRYEGRERSEEGVVMRIFELTLFSQLSSLIAEDRRVFLKGPVKNSNYERLR